jgi:hypothetical protein
VLIVIWLTDIFYNVYTYILTCPLIPAPFLSLVRIFFTTNSTLSLSSTVQGGLEAEVYESPFPIIRRSHALFSFLKQRDPKQAQTSSIITRPHTARCTREKSRRHLGVLLNDVNIFRPYCRFHIRRCGKNSMTNFLKTLVHPQAPRFPHMSFFLNYCFFHFFFLFHIVPLHYVSYYNIMCRTRACGPHRQA